MRPGGTLCLYSLQLLTFERFPTCEARKDQRRAVAHDVADRICPAEERRAIAEWDFPDARPCEPHARIPRPRLRLTGRQEQRRDQHGRAQGRERGGKYW